MIFNTKRKAESLPKPEEIQLSKSDLKEWDRFYEAVKKELKQSGVKIKEETSATLVKELIIHCQEENGIEYDMAIDISFAQISITCTMPFKFEAAALAVLALSICDKEYWRLDLYHGILSYVYRYDYFSSSEVEVDTLMDVLDMTHSSVRVWYEYYYKISKYGVPPKKQIKVFEELLKEGIIRIKDGPDQTAPIKIGSAYLEKTG